MHSYQDTLHPSDRTPPLTSSASFNTLGQDHSVVDNELVLSQPNLNNVGQLLPVAPVQPPVSATSTLSTNELETGQSLALSPSENTPEVSETTPVTVQIQDNGSKGSVHRALTVDIPQPLQTFSRSTSCNVTPVASPNQLRGIVIESLRAPICQPGGQDTNEDSEHKSQEMTVSDQQTNYLVDRQRRLFQRSRQSKGPRRSSQDSTTISSLSPAPSSTSHNTGTSSCPTDSTTPTNRCIRTGISGTASQDASSSRTYRTSLHSRTGSSVASTLCHSAAAESVASASRSTRGVRHYVRWARGIASDLGHDRCDLTKEERSLEFSPTTPPAMVMDGSQGELRRPTLKELSKRSTRYYRKDAPPSTEGQGTMCDKPLVGGKKGPKKPDSKAFFSNERTFMHWIKFGLLLGSMALTLLSFGKDVGMQVGLFLVLVAMSTLAYATTIFHLRHRWMEQMRVDVKFYDRIGPTILFASLFLAFAVNIALTMRRLVDDNPDDEGLNFYKDNWPLDI